ncbi:uncharacterized protein DUF3263 [Micromonospora kangleipakensis]|uniref:Uncharacterized protein DUF3263 n=1 Tax=Micromonospora kangleipakensis TaxID=1077942 RepID=A0A4Q8B5A8_9ACTN|nr:DUF3263 domain-containing protein [Micromonospora kangleipakensis]RZU71969.1 uncharacterized protein DUF3263 [Micromonospora kangleipakensis]
MSADASAAATDRPEPSGRVDVERRQGGGVVPPPRSAPAVEADPAAATEPADRVGSAEDVPADGPAAEAGPADGLTERERRILAFEQQWWKHAGAKEQAIRDTFGLSATRYYQLLNALLDHPAALAAEPVLIGRLRRLRSSRARNRRR